MSTDVMNEIRKLEEARSDYRRTQLQKDLSEAFAGGKATRWGSRENGGTTEFLDGPESAIKYIKPRIEQLLPQNSILLQARYDALAGNMDIADEEMSAAMHNVASSMKTDVITAAEDAMAAYTTTLQELEGKSNPWPAGDEKQAGALTRYMLELQLIGGPGGHKKAILENAEAAIASGDPGGIQFWHRNFSRLYPSAPDTRNGGYGDGGPPFENSLEVVRQLDKKRIEAMSPDQRKAYQAAENLRNAWLAADMDELVDVALNGPTADQLMGLAPRPRTDKEKDIAKRRSELRRAQRRIAEVQ